MELLIAEGDELSGAARSELFVVIEFCSEALALAPQKPDAVLLDITLPDFDGFEVCCQLKRDAATVDIPVVFLSAIHHDVRAKAMSESVGAKALLFYPVEADQLFAVLEGQIVKARLE